MDKAAFSLLKAELEAQAGEIEKIYDRIEERLKDEGTSQIEAAAYQLHNLYCAFEDLFAIIAKAFENSIEDKSRYHVELLKRMTISVPGMRPALLSRESYLLLESLRSFRHFFRHAYSYEINRQKVMLVYKEAIKLKSAYPSDLKAFLQSLSEK